MQELRLRGIGHLQRDLRNEVDDAASKSSLSSMQLTILLNVALNLNKC